MNITELPQLPSGVRYLGKADGPDETKVEDGGILFTVLWARYRIGTMSVNVGWTVNHVMGSFRDPNRLVVDFDSFDYGSTSGSSHEYIPEQAFNGITTALLRSIPMAHARALMRPRHEQLSVTSVREALSPLPTRVESEQDYLHIAMAYVALVNGSSVEPLQRLAEWTSESDETWSARLRRARTRGILLGKGREARLAPEYQAKADALWTRLQKQQGNLHGNQ